jgi:hypothetical protein
MLDSVKVGGAASSPIADLRLRIHWCLLVVVQAGGGYLLGLRQPTGATRVVRNTVTGCHQDRGACSPGVDKDMCSPQRLRVARCHTLASIDDVRPPVCPTQVPLDSVPEVSR